jgi:hypothetical protein
LATSPNATSFTTVVSEFCRLVDDLTGRGYLSRLFGDDCVDDHDPIDACQVVEAHLGRPGLWPMNVTELTGSYDDFLDLVEVLHDLVALPQKRWFHSSNGCGWRYSGFSASLGRAVYPWAVNRILDRFDLGLVLADEGEDCGRPVGASDEARTDLMRLMTEREEGSTGDRVRHALALFRARGASEHDKRSA